MTLDSSDRTFDLLDRLQSAVTDEEREWITTEFLLASLDSDLQEAVWVASIPHWFTQSFMAFLLGVKEDSFQPLFERLISLPFVQPFEGRGYNIHDISRSPLRDRFWKKDKARFRELSDRAAQYCAGQNQKDISWVIERIFHEVIASPSKSKSFIHQAIKWDETFETEKTEALVNVVLPEVKNGRIGDGTAAWALYFQSTLDLHYGRYIEAKATLNSVLKLSKQNKLLKSNCLFLLGEAYRMLDMHKNARAFYKKSLSLFQKSENTQRQADCIKGLGDVNYAVSDYNAARKLYELAKILYKGIAKKSFGLAISIKALGDVHLTLGEHESALALYEQALPLFKALNDKLGQANCVKVMGDAVRSLGKFDLARKYYDESYLFYQRIGDRLGGANYIKALGDLAFSKGDLKFAQTSYEQALVLYRNIGNLTGRANCLKSLGDTLLTLGKNSMAKRHFESAQKLYRRIGNRLGEAHAIQAIGDVYAALKNYDSAREQYEAALCIYSKNANRANLFRVRKKLSDIG